MTGFILLIFSWGYLHLCLLGILTCDFFSFIVVFLSGFGIKVMLIALGRKVNQVPVTPP